jgi:HAD superfamily hydrolase (TIGR01490 family)
MMRAAAFFDVDGTLLSGNVVRWYANLVTLHMPATARRLWTLGFALRVPYLFWLDRASRARFQAALYRGYRRFTPAEFEARAGQHFETHMRARLFPAALTRIDEHRQRGEAVVLVTGSLRPIVTPLAAAVGATDCVAAELEQRDGAYSGDLLHGALAGERKADAVGDWIARHGLDAAACHAYADSLDDIPMLRRVGLPHVVNARGKLARIAASEGWDMLRWGA